MVTRVLPDDAQLVTAGELMDGPLDPNEWEIYLGNHWRNADDMTDRRPGWGDLTSLTNGVHVVARQAHTETARLPQTARQKAFALIAAGAPGVTLGVDVVDDPDALGGDPHRVTQTILYDEKLNEEGIYGNCLQAALASLLARPLDAVPHFLCFRRWQEALTLWLDDLALGWRKFPYEGDPGIPSLILGRSPRGVDLVHVIARLSSGEEWDPHPSREGLESRHEVWYFPQLAPRGA